jgi:RNA polymerase sigma-70 factor (ECF subfamily)
MTDEFPVSETSTDDALVGSAGMDRAAFALLYDRYYPRVSRYCCRRLFDRTTAEDLTSDVFLRAASHWGASHARTFPGRTETDFRRWLFRVATNAVNAHLRQSRRRQKLWEAAARSRSNPAGNSPSSPGQPDKLDWPAVYQALLELSERDQTIVSLRFFAGCTHEEISEIVGATPGAVRTALSRTLTRLREKFQPAVPTDRTPGTPPQG